ncbi:MAG: prolyl oligopeptidase family serine peptidase [Cyanothece sp. SIO2G6]|nr:prolyl oligopeptidase family serine peptidase [Cyanothece sp. SIO2G6]
MNYLYLHGLASGPQSRKAQDLRDRLHQVGHTLHILDLNQGDFTQLTLSRQIQQVKDYLASDSLASDQPTTIIGSSLGGLTAAWVGQHCLQVQQLVLLAPAFQFLHHWRSHIPADQWQQWQQTGTMNIYHYGYETMMPLAYSFVADLTQYQETNLSRPVSTLVIHGVDDEVVPIQASQDYARERSHVILLEVTSDHALGDQLDEIWAAIVRANKFSNT